MNLEPKDYRNKRDQVIDFVIGVVGFFVVNAVLIALSTGISNMLFNFDDSLLLNIVRTIILSLPLLINSALLIYFAIKRKWISLGALSAFASLFLLALCAGILIAATCFVLSGQFRQ